VSKLGDDEREKIILRIEEVPELTIEELAEIIEKYEREHPDEELYFDMDTGTLRAMKKKNTPENRKI